MSQNYAEELGYWFLRLNGFFIIDNFVLHKEGLDANRQHGEADLLAVRFPNVYEDVGLKEHDDIYKLFRSSKNIGVLCEVKSNLKPSNKITLNKDDRLRYCVQRLGFYSHTDTTKINEVISQLQNNGKYEDNNFMIFKVLISNRKHDNFNTFNQIELQEIQDFIKQKINKYPRKSSPKLFYNSAIIQYILWEQENTHEE